MIALSLKQAAASMGVADPPNGAALVRQVSTDSRTLEPGDLFFALPGGRYDGHDYLRQAVDRGAVACVCRRDWFAQEARGDAIASPLCGLCLPVPDTVRALGQLASFYRLHVMRNTTVVVAVTGSNGKTTTKWMIDHVLRGQMQGRCSPRSYNNHIGVPLTLLSAEADDRYLVVEIGSNAPGEIAALAEIASPDVGIITSIGEAHLEGLGSLRGIAAEKFSLLHHVRPSGLAVVNTDRPEMRPQNENYTIDTLHVHARIVTFGFDPSANFRVGCVQSSIRRTAFELDGRYNVELGMPGAHHAGNAAAAFVVARWFGLAPERIIERFSSFEPAAGRSRVLDVGEVTLIDDSYNANPASMSAAIASLGQGSSGRRVLVMGDMLELGAESERWHRQMVRSASEAGIEVLVTVGAAMRKAVAAADTASMRQHVLCCEDAAAAGPALLSLLSPGDTVWVKGSRHMRMDGVVAYVKANGDRRAAVA